MKIHSGVSRRDFLSGSVVASAVLGASTLACFSAAPKPSPGSGVNRLKLGVASYSLRKFSLSQAIQMTQEAGVRYITLKDVHLPLKTTREERAAARKQIEDAGLVLAGGGVITMNTAEEVRFAFQYAKDAGMPVVVCNPDPGLLDVLEEQAKASGVLVAIHNHGPGDKRWPSPLDILERIRQRDRVMGICMDLGHTVRLQQDPIKVIQTCGDRLHDFHIKDVTAAAADGKAIEVGRGVVDIPGVLRMLVGMNFPYHVALEHELNENNPLPGMRESFGYMRGVLATLS